MLHTDLTGSNCLQCDTGTYDQITIEDEVNKVVTCTTCGHQMPQFVQDKPADKRLTLNES